MKGRMKKAFTALLAATVLVGGMPVNMQANVIAETEKAESASEKVNEKYADTEELDLMDRERQETQAGEQEIKYLEAIINSMTKAERANPDIINPARKRRIAAGSGTDVPRVNRVLKQYKQMKEMMKLLGGKGKNGKRRRRMPPFNPAMLKNMPPM